MRKYEFSDSSDDNFGGVGILIFCHSDAENRRKSGSEGRNK